MIQYLTDLLVEDQIGEVEEQLLNMDQRCNCNVFQKRIFSTVLLGLYKEQVNAYHDASETLIIVEREQNGPSRMNKVIGVVLQKIVVIVSTGKLYQIMAVALIA